MSASPDAALGIGSDTALRGAADAAQAASSLLLRLRAEGKALAQEADSRSPRVRHHVMFACGDGARDSSTGTGTLVHCDLRVGDFLVL